MEPSVRPLDPAVVAALVGGDARARDRFFDHFYDRVFRYVVHTVRDDHLAEDLTHEIFLKLHGSLHRLDPDRDPARWVFTVAANTIRDHWRRLETRVSRRSLDVDALAGAADRTARIDQSLVDDERHAQIHRAMATLSEDDREILALRTFGGLDTADVARVLGLRPDAVRQRWSRAVRRLGDAYRELDAAEGGAT